MATMNGASAVSRRRSGRNRNEHAVECLLGAKCHEYRHDKHQRDKHQRDKHQRDEEVTLHANRGGCCAVS